MYRERCVHLLFAISSYIYMIIDKYNYINTVSVFQPRSSSLALPPTASSHVALFVTASSHAILVLSLQLVYLNNCGLNSEDRPNSNRSIIPNFIKKDVNTSVTKNCGFYKMISQAGDAIATGCKRYASFPKRSLLL